MALPLRPNQGGFLRPFGCGWFIREFLLGHGPEGAPQIDAEMGACQEDIFYHYKLALHKAYAEDAVAWENEARIKAKKPIYTPEEYADRVDWYLRRIPYKLHKARYHSFQRYFHWLKQLGWVEFTGREEPSALQEGYPNAPSRKYYRLTKKGIEAPDYKWSRPQLVLYPHLGPEYFNEKRKGRQYTKKAPTKSRKSSRA